MGAVDLLGVEPDVPVVRLLQRQLIVLAVVPPHPDQISLGGGELPGLGGGELHLLFLVGVPDVAPRHQLSADLLDVLLRLNALELI